MNDQKIISYPYRWVILMIFMLMMALQQMLWITFASITAESSAFYRVSDLSIGYLSMVFMIVYIIVSIPCSWLIDTYGFRVAVGIGAVITGIFGLLRGIFAASFTMVLLCQIGIAIAQPLVVNASTKIAVKWFRIEERATANGLAWLGAYTGIILGMSLTPFLVKANGIPGMLLYYGEISIAAALIFLILARENPPTPQCAPDQEERTLVFDGLKRLLVKRDFIFLMLIFFVGLGAFNAIATWIEDIVKPRGFSSEQAGIMGGLMVASGIVGSAIVPMLSDKFRNRTHFILLAVAGTIPGLIGIAFSTSYPLLLVSSAVLGFFLLSAAPVGFQYGAETAFPAPEGTSTGILMMMGQVSGILFIFGMDMFKSASTGSMSSSMIIIILLMLVCIVASAFLRESALIRKIEERQKQEV